MDWIGLYHFLFETYAGMGIMIGAGLVISFIACIIMERRTRKTFCRPSEGQDDWSFFDDDDEEDSRITTRRPLTHTQSRRTAPATPIRGAVSFLTQSDRKHNACGRFVPTCRYNAKPMASSTYFGTMKRTVFCGSTIWHTCTSATSDSSMTRSASDSFVREASRSTIC